MYYWGRWPEYVSVASRKANAAKKIAALKKKGQTIHPVVIEGKNIASSFWGKGWCKHIESFSDYASRLPRGRSYVRHGSVIDLQISQGNINALVYGTSLYKIAITIKPVPDKKWKEIVKNCAGKIDSLIELLQGKFSGNVMEIITHRKEGLFPQPQEIIFNCSCPDYADMCKHIAATLYAIGTRLDTHPQDLFRLRHVDHGELITAASTTDKLTGATTVVPTIEESDLSSLFGIDIQSPVTSSQKPGEEIRMVKVANASKAALAKATKAPAGKAAKVTKKSVKKPSIKDKTSSPKKEGTRRFLDDARIAKLQKLYASRKYSAQSLCKQFDISMSTLFNYLKIKI